VIQRIHVHGDHDRVTRQPAGCDGFRGIHRDEIAVPAYRRRSKSGETPDVAF
jgi:hypothetical protein